jgi:regulator of sigma D
LTSNQKKELTKEVVNELEGNEKAKTIMTNFKNFISNIVEIMSEALNQLDSEIEIYYKEDSYLNFENYDVKEFSDARIK